MPTYDATIENFVIGDDLDIVRTVSAIPDGQTITEAWFTVRVFEAGGTNLVQKHITTTVNADGVIASNQLTFQLSKTDTALLPPANWCYYWIEIKTSANKEHTPEKGKIKGQIGIT